MDNTASAVKEVRHSKDATVIVLSGEIDLHHVPQVHPVLVRECDAKPATLIIDLTDVAYMDSSGVGVLVHVFQKVKGYRGKLRLVGMRERVRSVFEITRLDKYFVICATEEEALNA